MDYNMQLTQAAGALVAEVLGGKLSFKAYPIDHGNTMVWEFGGYPLWPSGKPGKVFVCFPPQHLYDAWKHDENAASEPGPVQILPGRFAHRAGPPPYLSECKPVAGPRAGTTEFRASSRWWWKR